MSHNLRLIFLIFASLLAGCSTVPDREPYDGPLSWPQPPDQPRFAYEAVLHSSANIARVSEEASLRERFTGIKAASDMPVMDKPTAIAARYGMIYVADTGAHNVVVFNIPSNRIFRIGLRRESELQKPVGLALDGEMKVYVVDAKLRKVMIYDGYGAFLRSVGDPKELQRPIGVAVSSDGERIYVVDRSFNESNQHRVVVYGKDGEQLQVIGSRGSEDGQFNIPLQAATGPDDTLYVLDSGNFRVQAFDANGNFLRSFGSPGKSFGSFARPRGIAVDSDGNVYVADAGFNNFQIFNPEGQLLLAVGQGGLESNPGRYGMLSGIAVDETGRVYVVDQLFNKVEVIRRLSDSEGKQMLEEHKKSTQ